MEQRNDEIDLLELSRNMMVRFYHYCQRRYKMLGLFIIIGGIIGAGLYFKDKNKYENSIIGTSYVVHPVIIVEIINSLQEINTNDKEALQELLKINKEEADALLQIKADTVQTIEIGDKESITTIEVKIKFKKNLNLESFSKHLCHYIDSNKYIAKELELEWKKSNELIKKYDHEIQKIDSLHKKIIAQEQGLNTTLRQQGLLVLNEKKDNDIIELEKEKQKEIKNLERITGFSIIDEKRGTKIKEVSLIETVAKMMAVLFGIGFFVSVVLEFKRQVKHIEFSKNK